MIILRLVLIIQKFQYNVSGFLKNILWPGATVRPGGAPGTAIWPGGAPGTACGPGTAIWPGTATKKDYYAHIHAHEYIIR